MVSKSRLLQRRQKASICGKGLKLHLPLFSAGIPAKPDCPSVEEFKDGEFEVVWKAPDDRGEPVTHYMLQYR